MSQRAHQATYRAYVVSLSTVCDAILGKGKLLLAKRPSTISLVLEVFSSSSRCSLGQGGRVSIRFDVATNDIDVFDVTMADNNRSQCVTATPFRRHVPF